MKIFLPEVLNLDVVLKGPEIMGWPWNPQESIIEIMAQEKAPRHVEPIALVAFSAWAAYLRRKNYKIIVDDSLKSPYLLRIGFLRALGGDPPWSDQVHANDGIFPLCRVHGERGVEAIGSGVAKTLNIPGEHASAALTHAISEIVRNAEEHSQSETATSFAAGYFRSQGRVSFVVADTGIGITKTLRRKGILMASEGDVDALLKAVQPHITGAGPIKKPGAPDNAGMGLHLTRLAAQDCKGEMILWSGSGCFQERNRRTEIISTPIWNGTLVSVTLYPERMGALIVPTLAVGIGGIPIFFDAGPSEALRLEPPIDSVGFAADKAWYREQRPRLMEALNMGQSIRVDFKKALYTTQSALHALLYQPLQEYGPTALSFIHFSSAGNQLKTVVRLVISYALEAHMDKTRAVFTEDD